MMKCGGIAERGVAADAADDDGRIEAAQRVYLANLMTLQHEYGELG